MRNNSIDQRGTLMNRVYVGVNGTFTTIKAAVDWFNANATDDTEILLDANHHEISDTVVVNNATYDLQIRGLGIGVTHIEAATGLTNKPMFEIKSNAHFFKVSFDGSTLASYGTLTTEDCIRYSTTANLYSEVTDFTIDTFYNAIHDTIGMDNFIFNFVISNCAVGYKVNYSTAAIQTVADLEVGNFENCPIGVDLVKATSESLLLMSIIFINPVGGIGIQYVGGAGNYVYRDPTNIFNCTFNEVGTFSTGFDWTIARDANVEMFGNVGTEDKLPHAKINLIDNLSTTTVTTGNVYYKAVFTNGSTYRVKIDVATSNRIQMLSSHHRDLKSWISGNLSVSNNGRTVNVALRKNIAVTSVTGDGALITVVTTTPSHVETGDVVQLTGWTGGTGVWDGLYSVTVVDSTTFTYVSTGNGTATGGVAGQIISPMTVRCTTQNIVYPFSMVSYIEDMGENDYIEIYVTDPNAGDTIVVSDINWLVVSQ